MRPVGFTRLPGSRPVGDPAKVVALRAAGLTQKQIATRTGISLTRIGSILREAGAGARQADKEL